MVNVLRWLRYADSAAGSVDTVGRLAANTVFLGRQLRLNSSAGYDRDPVNLAARALSEGLLWTQDPPPCVWHTVFRGCQ